MSTLRNKVQLIGNVGNDPEILHMESGKILAKFSIATNESYKNAKGEKITDTQWHNIVAWGKTAEIVEKYLSKGNEVAIEGKLTNRNYEDKDGNKKYFTELVDEVVKDTNNIRKTVKEGIIFQQSKRLKDVNVTTTN
jgi:single-strand DNA-binding protein